MRARYPHRITLEQRKELQNPNSGAVELVWVALDKGECVPAKVSPVSGREIALSGAEAGVITARIRINYRPDVDSTMRVVHRGKCYNINAALPDAETGLKWLTLHCTQGASDGR